MPSYSGVWNLTSQLQAKAQGLWPLPPLFTTVGNESSVSALQLQRAGIATLSDTVAIYAYLGYNTGTGVADIYAVVATRSGSSISYGTPITVRSGLSPQGLSICKLSSTTALITYETSASNYLGGKILTVSGTSVSAGSEATISVTARFPSVTRLTDTTAFCCYDDASTGALRVVVGSASGSTLSWGSPSSVTGKRANAAISVGTLSSTSAITIFDDSTASNRPTVFVTTISGTSISAVGTTAQIETTGVSTSSPWIGIAGLSSSNSIAVWKTSSPSGYAKAVGMTVSGTTVTVGTPITYSSVDTSSSGPSAQQPISAATSTTAFSVYRPSGITVNKFVLSGTTVSVDNSQQITTDSGRASVIAPFSSTIFLLGDGSSAGNSIYTRVLQA